MRRKAILWINLICFILYISGCSTAIHTKPLFQYQISPLPSEKRINKIAGFNRLLDSRPQGEKDSLPGDKAIWRSVSDRISSLLVTDFEKSQIFKEIHYPAQSTDDIVINGSIDRLVSESKKTINGKIQAGEGSLGWLAVFLPVLALPFLLGAPLYRDYCTIDISLVVKDNKTGAIIAQVKESSKGAQGISLYSFSKFGQSATKAFREVANKLKKDLVEKVNTYFNSQIAGVVGEK